MPHASYLDIPLLIMGCYVFSIFEQQLKASAFQSGKETRAIAVVLVVLT
jgi:hypothetical protein